MFCKLKKSMNSEYIRCIECLYLQIHNNIPTGKYPPEIKIDGARIIVLSGKNHLMFNCFPEHSPCFKYLTLRECFEILDKEIEEYVHIPIVKYFIDLENNTDVDRNTLTIFSLMNEIVHHFLNVHETSFDKVDMGELLYYPRYLLDIDRIQEHHEKIIENARINLEKQKLYSDKEIEDYIKYIEFHFISIV